MDNQPVETHNHRDQRGSVPQNKTYMAEKLRGATVMLRTRHRVGPL
jgi:hypothetical protein